jgi:pimeloyl-ACP methyl ester carboxylesterase
MGHEGAEFAELLATTPHRAIAPTLYGFDVTTAGDRVPLDIEGHLTLLRELLKEAVERLAPTRTVLIGFSSGADVALRMLVNAPSDMPRVDGCLALGPNLSLETCFVSRVFARLRAGSVAPHLDDLRSLGADTADFDEWLNVMTYVVHVLRKFRGDLGVLNRFAAGILHPFEQGDDAFAAWFRDVADRVPVLRCVFERSPLCVALLRALRLRHFDDGLLGPHDLDAMLLLASTRVHHDLMDPARLARDVEAVVTALA